MSGKRALLSNLAAVGFAVGMAAVALPASASTDGLPDGSWRQSCDRAYVSNGALHATCKRNDGNYTLASARIGSCRAFGNRDGTLFCESSDGSSGNVGQWSGSFRDSCRDISVDKHGKLKATCRKDNGTYKRSNLQAQKCPSYRAGNRDGNLFCESNDTGGSSASRWDGSFRKSCRDLTVDSNGTLTATCRTENGSWRRTRLSSQQCGSYRAGNRNGNLFCESDDGGSQDVRQWDGSFRNSCRDLSVDSNGTLTANCQKMNGTWNRSSLSSRQCSSHRAGNRDGNLFCEADDGGSQDVRQWDGSFRNSCRDLSVDSNGTLTATCQAANGNWRRSSLSSRQCSSHRAGNRDGTLVCESDDGGSQDVRQWDGSFRNSCRDLSVDSNGTLTANCQKMNGTWNRSSLSSRQCSSHRAGNRDGTLVCER